MINWCCVFGLSPRIVGVPGLHADSSQSIAEYTFAYDAAGRMTQMTSPDGSSDYTLDDIGQLTGTDHDHQADENYTYDANGNRTNDGYSTGQNNRMLSDGTYNYTYDDEGNRLCQTEIATGAVREFQWDYRNRLISVTDRDSAGGAAVQVVEFTYDAMGNRIAMVVDADGDGAAAGQATYFVYDGDHIILEYTDSGSGAELAYRYLHGPVIDQVLAAEGSNGEVLWALTDHQGSVRDLINSAGTVANHITYDSFGNITAESDAAVDFRFSYTGRELDAATGLFYYRARYYDAAAGRFISEDPASFDAGDMNLYRYVTNNPMTLTDPSGLCGFGGLGVYGRYYSLDTKSASEQVRRDQHERYLQERQEVLELFRSQEAYMNSWQREISEGMSEAIIAQAKMISGITTLELIINIFSVFDEAEAYERNKAKGGLSKAIVNRIPLMNMAPVMVEAFTGKSQSGYTYGQKLTPLEHGKSIASTIIYWAAVGYGATRTLKGTGPSRLTSKPSVKPAVKSADPWLSRQGIRPAPGTRVRPQGVPKNWRIRSTKKLGGVRYYDPANPGHSVRVMQGNPNSPFVNSQSPYVRWQAHGQPLDTNGNILPTKFGPDAHIPLQDFKFIPEVPK
ncbi:MAG: hypothetical protein K8S55_07070 [Phycisphaerae bacterium]|nr:hypothetical protein [Phycisphaerae bacterium]